MSEDMWVRSHLERLLQDQWNVCRVDPDPDGDYFFRCGTAVCWVGITTLEPMPMVRVWAVAAEGVKPTVAMWRELNDIQLRCRSCAVVWADGRVIVSQTISAVGLTGPVLTQALDAVGSVADDIGLLVAGMFGGSTPHLAQLPEDEDAV